MFFLRYPVEEWVYTEGETKIPIESIDDDDDSDLSSSDRVPAGEMQTIRVYRRYGIKHFSMWRKKGERRAKTVDEYPLKWNHPCSYCRNPKIKDYIPIFTVDDYDNKMECFELGIFAFHSPVCAMNSIVEGNSREKDRKISLFYRFIREYFDPNILFIPHVPITLVKEINPFGIITMDEYLNKAPMFNGMIRKPPFRFVETYVELISPEEKQRQREIRFDQMANSKATPEQQEQYRSNLERVAKERRENGDVFKNSHIIKKLFAGSAAKKQKL